MPRIDPQQLLKCLSVLLSSSGGIKSQDEVQRLASLMTKFSKKLVSKCIYVSILKATQTDLLIMFMSAGGWDLTYSWLTDGVTAKNWPLVKELVDLLLICPVDIDRLKTNACPKLIKTLSKDVSGDESVRLLACKLVEHWLRIVKGDLNNSSSTTEQTTVSNGSTSDVSQVVSSTVPDNNSETVSSSDDLNSKKQDTDKLHTQESINKSSVSESNVKNDTGDGSNDEKLPVYKITIRDGKKVLAEISGDRRSSTEATEDEGSTEPEDANQEEEEEPLADGLEDDDDDDDYVIKPVKIKRKPPVKKPNKQKVIKRPAKVQSTIKKDRDSTDSASSMGKPTNQGKDINKPLNNKKVNSDQLRSNSKNKADTKNIVNLNKEVEESVSVKAKEKNLKLRNKKVTASVKEITVNKPDKLDFKEKMNFLNNDTLTDKEKETLSKFITPPISKVGKIPKKTSSSKEEKQSEEKNRTLKDEKADNNTDFKKSFDIKKPEIKRPEKKFSISVEPKRNVLTDSRPKTVKTFNSKFRSTGLEEEIKPPPPRPAPKKLPPSLPPPVLEKKLGKRNSPPPEVPVPEKKSKPESPVPEKKSKPESPVPEKKSKPEPPQEEKKTVEKVGGIKLIPPKPKPMFLQESDVFMDAMLAANTMKEPRKRKRRGSVSKDSSQSDAKKEAGSSNSPSNSPKGEENSPSSIKPTFKFYQDTLDTSADEDRADSKAGESMEFSEPDQSLDDQKSLDSEDSLNGPLKSVLVHPKSKKQKKTVTWKEVGLESIKYFELDETERVNVTKNFADMKSMEREHERENIIARRMASDDDRMEEQMGWKALIPIDIAAPVIPPGKNSQEKDIQYAREKTVTPADYFHKRMIPDSPAEPDLEIHATTDPVPIPMDDVTNCADSINDFTSTPWPEPKGMAPPEPAPAPAPPPPPAQPAPPAFQPSPAFPPQGPFPPMGPFMPGPAPPGMPIPTGECWRTGDGKVVPMPPEMFGPQGMMPPMGPGMPPMGPGPIMLPPGVTPDMPFPIPMPPGPNPSPEEMAQFGGFPPMGPAGPQMFGPPPPQMGQNTGMGGNWQNPGGGGGGGNWFPGPDNDQPPVHHNQGNNQGRYQGNNWRGGGGNRGGGSRGGGRNRKYSDSWGNNRNSRVPQCKNFARGFCRNNNCRFRHS